MQTPITKVAEGAERDQAQREEALGAMIPFPRSSLAGLHLDMIMRQLQMERGPQTAAASQHVSTCASNCEMETRG